MESRIRKELSFMPVNVCNKITERYNVSTMIGDGSFGNVYSATPTQLTCRQIHRMSRNTVVAVKTVKKNQTTTLDCRKLREFIFLSFVPSHFSLVYTYELLLDSSAQKFNIVMETMDMSLIQLIETRRKVPFSEQNLKLILYQILLGLEHIHNSGFFHRDIKPENVLVSKVNVPPSKLFKIYSDEPFYQVDDNVFVSSKTSLGSFPSSTSSIQSASIISQQQSDHLENIIDNESYIIKLGDFGLARNTDCPDPYTSYVSTRWYRAPELLLRRGVYSCPIDIWAFGTMAAEISMLKPLFPGKSEYDQFYRQVKILGRAGPSSPAGSWDELPRLVSKHSFCYPRVCIIFYFFFSF